MAESYEDYLKRVQSVYGMPGGSMGGKSTMTVPSTPDYRRTQWGNSLSNDDLTALVQAGVDNRNLIEPVFDPANPITSKVTTEKDHLGNSVTKTYKGNFEPDKGTPNFDKVGAAASSAYDAVEGGVSSFYDGVNSWGSGVADIVGDKFDAGISAVNGVRQDVESSVGSAYEDVNEFGSSMADSVSGGYQAAKNAVVERYSPVFDSEEYLNLYQSVLDTDQNDRYFTPINDAFKNFTEVPFINKILNGNSVPEGKSGSDSNIAAAELEVSRAIEEAEKELNISYDVPSVGVHPVDSHPTVVAAKAKLVKQLQDQERFESKDGLNVSKILESETVESILDTIQQKSYEYGDAAGAYVKENPLMALATVAYGGKLIQNVGTQSWQLITRLASKAPGLLKKLKWFVAPNGGLLFTLAGGEQIVKNIEDIDAFIQDNVPQEVLNPIDWLTDNLTDTEKPDSEIVDDMEIILTSAENNSSADTDVAILDSTEVPTNKAGVDSVNPNEPAVAEPAPETSIFEAVTPGQLEAPVVKDLIENAGVENLSPTTDEAAVVLSKTPELIEVMNSLADYMDSSTDEDALAAARQTAIDIENDPSHSDLSSAAAMTFIASMMFGGNMTDSFNAAFKPVGNYYEAKKAAAIKRKDEAVAEKTRIDLENRAAALEQTKYDRNLADVKEAAALKAGVDSEQFNLEMQMEADMFNLGERNDLIIAGIKEKGDVSKAFIKSKEVEKKRVLTARNTFLTYAQTIPTNDFKEMLIKRKLPSFAGQLTEALTQMKGIFNKRTNEYGDPLEFDMSVLENRSAVISAIENYMKDVESGSAFRRTLPSYVTDMIIKRELVGATKNGIGDLEQVIKPNFFQVPDEGNQDMLRFKPKGSDFNDNLYIYKEQKKRGVSGKTDFAFAETTAKIHDFITSAAFSKKTGDGNSLGMTKTVQLFGRDYTDAQTNDPAYFDRVVRAAVKEGVHPFTYFVLQYMKTGKGELGNRFPAK
jgi:hypothetical protein